MAFMDDRVAKFGVQALGSEGRQKAPVIGNRCWDGYEIIVSVTILSSPDAKSKPRSSH
jgi:hypothetical protein